VKQGHDTAHTPKFYVVQSGDTLTSIAHENGVPVARILRLNPGVDPQILISGEKLKLR
jgi:LysM repeat protein